MMANNIEYTDQTLVIPADICKILERGSLLDIADDFALSIEVENGKVVITDLMEYIVKGYRVLKPEEAWVLVRKWWLVAGKHVQADKEIAFREREISKLRNEVMELEKAKKTKWKLW
jgi:hypothetical protein